MYKNMYYSSVVLFGLVKFGGHLEFSAILIFFRAQHFFFNYYPTKSVYAKFHAWVTNWSIIVISKPTKNKEGENANYAYA